MPPDINRIGIPDLADALAKMAQDRRRVSDLRGLSPDKRAGQNDLNSRIAWKQLRTILAARIVVVPPARDQGWGVTGKT